MTIWTWIRSLCDHPGSAASTSITVNEKLFFFTLLPYGFFNQISTVLGIGKPRKKRSRSSAPNQLYVSGA